MDTNIDIIIESRTRELVNDFKVRRVLPSAKRRMVGPFIFFDEMGPEILSPGKGLDVAPHPHIGLATITYLFKGEILHRDSLGSKQAIHPGAVNWMTAGSGIAHSERTPQELRKVGSELFGIQSWIALPAKNEETPPTFSHYEADKLPYLEDHGTEIRIIAGSLYGEKSPVVTFSEMFYADVHLNESSELQIPAEYEERAVFIVGGSLKLPPKKETFTAGQLIICKPGSEIIARADSKSAHLMLLGGQSIGKRHIWWNFVSSTKERIEQGKEDWKAGRFGKIPKETEFIPLPEEPRPGVVRYP